MKETEKALLRQIDEFIEKKRTEIRKEIAGIVAIPSDAGNPEPGAPYGSGVRLALNYMLHLASRQGLTVHDGGGYVGWAELPGCDSRYLATFSHVDTVPAGDGWTGDPYTLREKEGWLIGLGVGDDKAAGVLCVYAAKFLKDAGIPLRYSLRILFGTNEETGMSDVPVYLQQEKEPLFCFTPDADFPVCSGEKGMFMGGFRSERIADSILELSGGSAPNIVPKEAVCLLKCDPPRMVRSERIETEYKGNGKILIRASGVEGHAGWPENTVNAIGVLVDYLLENGLCRGKEKTFLELLQKLHGSIYGAGLGIGTEDATGAFSPLTCVGGMISIQDGAIVQDINIRFPPTISGAEIEERLRKEAHRCHAELYTTAVYEPFFFDADHPAIACMMSAYRDVTGSGTAPTTLNGVSYARKFQNCVNFGFRLEQHSLQSVLPEFVRGPHSADEGVCEEDLFTALKIFILTIVRMQETDL